MLSLMSPGTCRAQCIIVVELGSDLASRMPSSLQLAKRPGTFMSVKQVCRRKHCGHSSDLQKLFSPDTTRTVVTLQGIRYQGSALHHCSAVSACSAS